MNTIIAGQEPADGTPRTVHVTDLVRLANCPMCWQRPGRPCNARGDHLARYMRAEKRGLISRDALAAAVAGLEVIAEHVYVRAGAE